MSHLVTAPLCSTLLLSFKMVKGDEYKESLFVRGRHDMVGRIKRGYDTGQVKMRPRVTSELIFDFSRPGVNRVITLSPCGL